MPVIPVIPSTIPGTRYDIPNVGPGTVRRVVTTATATASAVTAWPYGIDTPDYLFDTTSGAYLGRAE